MKAKIQTDFLCSYYYHAALAAKRHIMEHVLPESLYYSITALVLWQCVLESYINFLIHKRNFDDLSIKRSSGGRTVKLINASIKEKWIHFPTIAAHKQFTLNAEPFKDFEELVDLRNELIHFDVSKLTFTKAVPPEIRKLGELKAWMGKGGLFAGTKFEKIVRFAAEGELITREMILRLHKMLGSKAPDFLTGTEVVLKITIEKP